MVNKTNLSHQFTDIIISLTIN